MLRQEQNI